MPDKAIPAALGLILCMIFVGFFLSWSAPPADPVFQPAVKGQAAPTTAPLESLSGEQPLSPTGSSDSSADLEAVDGGALAQASQVEKRRRPPTMPRRTKPSNS